MKVEKLLIVPVLLITLTMGGCRFQPSALFQTSKEENKGELIRVEIVFTDNQRLTAYVKQLGIEDTAQVYAGGTSSTNLYDLQGNIIGSMNYQHVIYMRVLPKETKSSK